MAKVIVTDTHLTDIANAIRDKKGTTDTYKPSEMANAIESIKTGGADTLTQRLNNTLITYSNGDVTKLPDSTFLGCTNLQRVNLPNCTRVDASAFSGCTNLQSVDMPNLSIVGHSAFLDCQNLDGNCIDFSKIIQITNQGFENCLKLPSTIRFTHPNFNYLNSYCFRGCASIKTIDLPEKYSSWYGNVFNGITNLTALIIRYSDKVISNNGTQLINCGFRMWGGKSALAKSYTRNQWTTNYGKVGYNINWTGIESAYSGTIVYLEGVISDESNKPCWLFLRHYTNNTTNCIVEAWVETEEERDALIEQYSIPVGEIYVPDSLVESYKAATNWVNFNSQIKGLSELEG